MMCNVARDPSFAHRGRSNLRSASVSRVPCRNNIGVVTLARWSARFVPGRLGGCSGKPKNTNPRTPSSGRCAAACEVIRPPMDLPPANNGKPGAASAAARTAATTVAVNTAGARSEEHTSELQSRLHLVCRLLLEKKNTSRLPPHDTLPVGIPPPQLTFNAPPDFRVVISRHQAWLWRLPQIRRTWGSLRL